jgi:hypothetical protein
MMEYMEYCRNLGRLQGGGKIAEKGGDGPFGEALRGLGAGNTGALALHLWY